MKLSKRLELVASFVPEGSRLADVGTDHGYVPIYLVEKGVCPSAIAMDVGKGPLERAREHIREMGMEERIQTRLGDGLAALLPGEADTVVIAGMGGELVIHILEEGRHMWESVKQFVLSPQSDLDKVRRYLAGHGFAVRKEEMVLEDGKYYTVMLVQRGKMEYENQAQYLYGKELIDARSEVLASFLQKEKNRMQGILAALSGQDTQGALEAKADLEEQLSWIKEAEDEMR
ncbi:MAG: class I SAM-dependent methyltransferase [Lachnospiraceae bacterium]|nr:class I SAM-dependent methyltransferase [Lachnospiraceae bacterium]